MKNYLEIEAASIAYDEKTNSLVYFLDYVFFENGILVNKNITSSKNLNEIRKEALVLAVKHDLHIKYKI